MIPLAWYALGTLACWAGFGLIRIGRAANRGHAACERLARRAVAAVDESIMPAAPGLPIPPPHRRPIGSGDCTRPADDAFVAAQYGRTFTISRDALFTCPVCDYRRLLSPPEDHLICPSCGTEFGYHDAAATPEGTHRRRKVLRERWLSGGRRWHSQYVPQPTNWSGGPESASP